jgi:hypothetical protein
MWGGAANNRIFKNLTLRPRAESRGERLDTNQSSLIELALRLDHRIAQGTQFGTRHQKFRLPRLWAGFRQADASRLQGEGPELDELCTKFDLSREAMLRKFKREWDGLCLVPLDWVSGQLSFSVAVFAEMERMPKRQLLDITDWPGSLSGISGASAFDLFESPYRHQRCKQKQAIASAFVEG